MKGKVFFMDWKRKLTSRKLWLAVAAFISGLITAFGGADSLATTISGCLLQFGAVVSYILAEGWIDANSAVTVAIEQVTDNEE